MNYCFKKSAFMLIVAYLFIVFSTFSYADGFGGLLDNIASNSSFTIPEVSTYSVETLDGEKVLSSAAAGKKLTIMVYMCGSNLESMPQASASDDLMEMIRSGYSIDEINLLVMPGGAKKWHADFIDSNETGIYAIQPNGVAQVWRGSSNMNMGSPESLLTFLNFSYNNFMADRFALVFWDHGGGSIGGVCHDENYNDVLSMNEMTTAFENSCFTGDNQLEWIGFDACLMASTEVALMLSPYAKYLVASEETEPGFGWNYEFLNKIDVYADGSDAGEKIIDSYFDWYSTYYPSMELTMSCVDLSKVDKLSSEIEQYFHAVNKTVGDDSFSAVSKMIRSAKFFGNKCNSSENTVESTSSGSGFDLVDLVGLVDSLSGIIDYNGTALTKTIIDDVVTKSRSTLNETALCGLTIYHPLMVKKDVSKNISVYKSFDIMPEYTEHIEKFGKILTSPAAVNFSGLLASYSDLGKVQRTQFSLPLTEEQLFGLASAELIVLEESANIPAAYHLVSVNDSVIVDESGKLAGEYINQSIFITDSSGNPVSGSYALYYSINSNGQYMIPVTIEIQEDGELYTIAAYLICDKNIENELVLSSIMAYDDIAQCYTERYQIDFSTITGFIFSCDERTVTRDISGAIKGFYEWDLAGSKEFRWSISQDYRLMLIDDYIKSEKLCIIFNLMDTQSNCYSSELINLSAPFEGRATLLNYDDNDKLILINNPQVDYSGNNNEIWMSFNITSTSEKEITIVLSDITSGSISSDERITIYGTGDNWGLLNGETQTVFTPVLINEGSADKTKSIDFTLSVSDSLTGDLLGNIPVTIIIGTSK